MEKVLLLLIRFKNKQNRNLGDEFEEMRDLVYSSKGNILDSLVANIDKPTPNYFLRKGKLAELKEKINIHKPASLIVNIDLSPAQNRNLEEYLKVKVIDRTGLILDIFAHRAKTRDGKLQVELAQYMYLLPRISIMWEKLSKLAGGIGTRGPGEQLLERDKRKIRKHITKLNKEIERLKKHRHLIRQSRKRKEFPICSIVGYTNAGKSTILNKLTNAMILAEDKLFATLDPITRKYVLPSGKSVLFTDTVGFLLDLPHTLVKAFHSTLEEINESDLVLIVLDCSNHEYLLHFQVVQKILKEIHAESINQLIVFNKIDCLDREAKRSLLYDFPDSVLISANLGEGLDVLIKTIEERLLHEN